MSHTCSLQGGGCQLQPTHLSGRSQGWGWAHTWHCLPNPLVVMQVEFTEQLRGLAAQRVIYHSVTSGTCHSSDIRHRMQQGLLSTPAGPIQRGAKNPLGRGGRQICEGTHSSKGEGMGPALSAPAGALLLCPAALNSIKAAWIHLLLLLHRNCLSAAQRHPQIPRVTPEELLVLAVQQGGGRLNYELISFDPATLLLIKLPCSAQHWFGGVCSWCQCTSSGTLMNTQTKSTFSVKASPGRLKPCRNLYCGAVQQNTSCPLCEDCTIILFDVTKAKKEVQKGCTEGWNDKQQYADYCVKFYL